jgi:hypothetical protein
MPAAKNWLSFSISCLKRRESLLDSFLLEIDAQQFSLIASVQSATCQRDLRTARTGIEEPNLSQFRGRHVVNPHNSKWEADAQGTLGESNEHVLDGTGNRV